MIEKIDRLGTETKHDGWFMINEKLKIRLVAESDKVIRPEFEFDEDVMSLTEAEQLAQELIDSVFNGATS